MRYTLTIAMVLAVIIFACTSTQAPKSFEQVMDEIHTLNQQYSTTWDSVPTDPAHARSLSDTLKKLSAQPLLNNQDAFDILIGARTHELEGLLLLNKTLVYGRQGTTRFGFGCASKPIILESAGIRLDAADHFNQSIMLYEDFFESYVNESQMINLSIKKLIPLQALHQTVAKDAHKDISTINGLCKEDQTSEQQTGDIND